MSAIDDQNSVMYVSAYTKLLGCGLRLGYGVVPPAVRDTLTKIRFDLGALAPLPEALAGFGIARDYEDLFREAMG